MREDLPWTVARYFTFFFECKIFPGLLGPGTNNCADRGLHMSMFPMFYIDRRIVTDASLGMISGASSRPRDQCDATVPQAGVM